MNKKRNRSVYTKRRKVSKPRSSKSIDSGVSLKSSPNVKDETKTNLDSNDSSTVEGTDKNIEPSQKLKVPPHPVNGIISVPGLERSQLAFIDDENFLDYEPSDDEIDTNSPVANNKKSIGNNFEEPKINKNEEIKFNTAADLEADANFEKINETNLSKSVSPAPDFSHSIVDNNLRETTGNFDDDMDIESDHRNEQIFEEDFNLEEDYLSYDENELSHEEDEQDSVNNLFGNAQVHFNGPLNITITRPLNNNTQSQVPQTFNDMTPNSNLSSVAESPNVKIISMSTLKPEKNLNTQEYFEKKNWTNTLTAINCPRVTLSDDIFTHNVNHIGTLEDINLKLPFEEIHSEQSRSSITENNALWNREEYEMQQNDKESFVTQWLMRNNEDCFSKLLNSLCESHFTTVCNNLRCSKTHSMEDIRKTIHRSSFQEFEEYYSITLTKDLWFTLLFDIFLECFTIRPNKGEVMLIDMINDVYKVFNGSLTDKTSYVVKIIQNLRKIGLTFKQAIKRVILRYGTTQLWICDILLFIIAAEPNLEDHWCLVQKITSCRKEKIDTKVVIEVLNSCLKESPPNVEFCKWIYQDIFERNLADVTKVPVHLRALMLRLTGNITDPEEKLLLPVSIENSVKDNFRPVNPISRSLQIETVSSNEDMLHHDTKVMSDHFSDSDGSSDIVEEEVGEFFNKQTNSRYAELATHKRKQLNTSGKVGKLKSLTPGASRSVNNRVLKNVIESLNTVSKPHTPANVIAHPSFQPRIDPLYQCNISLHNLLPKVQCILTDITSTDLERLKNALRDEDTGEFLDLLQSYSDLYSIENFIVNVLTLLKSISNSSVIYSLFVSLLNAPDKMGHDCTKEIYLKVTLEVLALNLIYMLNSNRNRDLSRNILLKVKDWHSLVTSKVFLRKSNLESHMGRYIYIIKVLVEAEDFSWANEIFQAEALKLLGPTSSWPYKYKPSDVKLRNIVLEAFLSKCFPHNIFITNDLLKHIVVVYGGYVDGFDLWTWFSNEILSLLKKGESSKSMLMLLRNDIINYYERYMDKNCLQTYMLHMVNSFTSDIALSLFKKCCNRGIYCKYTGEERILHIKTNYTDFEITSLLHCYFENFRTGRVSPHDFYIDLVLPEMDLMESAMTENYRTNRSVHKVFEIVCNILDSIFGIKIDQPVLYRIYVSI